MDDLGISAHWNGHLINLHMIGIAIFHPPDCNSAVIIDFLGGRNMSCRDVVRQDTSWSSFLTSSLAKVDPTQQIIMLTTFGDQRRKSSIHRHHPHQLECSQWQWTCARVWAQCPWSGFERMELAMRLSIQWLTHLFNIASRITVHCNCIWEYNKLFFSSTCESTIKCFFSSTWTVHCSYIDTNSH